MQHTSNLNVEHGFGKKLFHVTCISSYYWLGMQTYCGRCTEQLQKWEFVISTFWAPPIHPQLHDLEFIAHGGLLHVSY